MQASKVLVVDGNRTARDTLITCLQFVGVEAHGAECAASARGFLSNGVADVVVLTDELAGRGLAELVEQCGSRDAVARISILMLTRASEPELASNYLVDATLRRPVPLSRVVESVESLLDQRRSSTTLRLTFGALHLDVANSRAELGDRAFLLGPTEARLLAFFMGLPEKVFSRAQLLQRLWPANVRVAERTVDVHIRRLRAALEYLGCATYIQTVRGSGYRFSHQPD